MVKFANRVKVAITQNSGSWPGTGTVYLGAAAAGYQSIPTSLNGETIRFVLEHGTDWEIGSGTFNSSAQTVTRSLASSSTGSLLDIDGAANIFISPSAEDLQYVEVYSSTSDLPSASSNHGRIAHVHGDGAMYFAHSGNWVRLGNHSDITSYTLPTASSSTLGGIKIGTGLSIDGSGVVTASGSGGSATVNYSPAFVGARWKFTSTQSGITGGVLTNYTTRDYDTTANNDFTGTNSRFTVPAGVSRVVVKASAETSNVTSQTALKITMNGGDVESTNIDIESTGGDYVFASTAVIEVTEDDYFEAYLFSSNSRSVYVDDRFTWFEIRVIEGSILNSVPQSVQPYDANLKSFTDTFTLPTSDGSANQVLKTDGSGVISFADQSGGIALTDLSVTQNSASGSGALSYNNTSGVFSYTPPASLGSSSSGGSLEPITTTKTVVSSDGETAFTGSWKAENISVFLNGVKLQDSEVTATDTQVTISATAAGDIVEVVEYGAPFASPYASTFPNAAIGATSVTVDYTPDKVAVYKNGVKLRGGGVDFTASNGTSITGFSAFVANDVVEVVEHGSLANDSILDLTDTPSSLGTAGQILQMNSGATAVEFADAPSGGVTTGKAIAMAIVFGG